MVSARYGDGAQRRSSVRVASGHIGCKLWTLGAERCDSQPMRVDNLSADGALVVGRGALTMGQTVRCQLVPEAGPFLFMWARVIRAEGNQVALEFVLNEEPKRDRIHRWVVEEQARLRRQ